MTPAPHQKIIMGKDPATVASRLPAFKSHRWKMYPLPRETAAATSRRSREGNSRCCRLLPGSRKAECRTASRDRMLSSKEANLASSRNTASSHGETHWVLCRSSHQQGDWEPWGKSERAQGWSTVPM